MEEKDGYILIYDDMDDAPVPKEKTNKLEKWYDKDWLVNCIDGKVVAFGTPEREDDE